MTSDVVLKVIGLLGAAGLCGAVASILVARMQRPKIAADARRVDAETEGLALANAAKVEALVTKRLAPIEARDAECQRQLTELSDEVAVLRGQVVVLEQTLRANGIAIPATGGYRSDIARRRAHRQGDTP